MKIPIITRLRWPKQRLLRIGTAIVVLLVLIRISRLGIPSLIPYYNQLKLLLSPPSGGDMWILKQYADNIAHGSLPYSGFHPEYPPLAFFFIYLPYLIDKDPISYLFWYSAMVTVTVGIGACVLWLWDKSFRKVWAYLFLLFLLESSEYRLVYTNFNMFVAVLTLVSVYSFYRKKMEAAGWFILFLATMTKVYPGVLAVPFFFQGKNRLKSLWFIVPMIVSNMILIQITHGQYLQFFQIQQFRPPELNSIPAAVMIGLHLFRGLPLHSIYKVNSWGLSVSDEMLHTIRIVVYLITLIPLLILVKKIRRYHPVRTAAILVTAFMLSNIVLSPGYLVWLVPFVVFLDTQELLLFTACAFVTSGTFQYWNDLWSGKDMNEYLLFLLFLKGLLLYVFYIKLFFSNSWVSTSRFISPTSGTDYASYEQ